MSPHQRNLEQCWKLRFPFLQCETFPLLSYHILNELWLFLQHIFSNIGTTIPLGMPSFYLSLLPELPYSCLLCPDLQPLSLPPLSLPLHNVDPVDLIFFPLCLAVRCLVGCKQEMKDIFQKQFVLSIKFLFLASSAHTFCYHLSSPASVLLQMIWSRSSPTILGSVCFMASSCCLFDYPWIVWFQPLCWYLWKAWDVKKPISLCELLCSDICACPKLTNDLSQTH